MTFAETVRALRSAGCVYAADEARLILACDNPAAALRRRMTGEPLEAVLGWVEFAGHRFALDPGVFVPRARSEALLRQGLAQLSEAPAPMVLDLCCGSGALGAALARARPDAEVHGSDLDPAAVRNAQRNLARVHAGDLFDPLPPSLAGRLDLILCNAPYVPSEALGRMPIEAREHEPQLALDGGTDGLAVHRRIAGQLGRWLAPGGVHLIELHRDQVAQAAQMFAEEGLRTRAHHDPEFETTVLTVQH